MPKRPLALAALLLFAAIGSLVALVGAGVGDGALDRVLDQVLSRDSRPVAGPPTTVPDYPEPSPRPGLPSAAARSVEFSCDFTVACELDQFVQFRDGFVVKSNTGRADHAPSADATFDDPVCTAPEETREWRRDQPFDLTYRCIPGGDLDAAHQMSVVPDTTGYSFTGSSPNLVFDDVERISFSVNMTSVGARNFWEVAVIPAETAWVDAMPCITPLPCNDAYDYDDIGAVGFGNLDARGSGFQIGTPEHPDGISFTSRPAATLDDGGIRYEPCIPDETCLRASVHRRQTDVRARYGVVIEARADGLWFGQEAEDGTMHWAVAEGEALPAGPVRVVLKFHGYTPTKSGQGPGFHDNLSASEYGFTWHWDDFEVVAGTSIPSAEYYGELNPQRFSTASAPECIAFAQGQRDEQNRTVFPVLSCPEGVSVDNEHAVYGAIEGLVRER